MCLPLINIPQTVVETDFFVTLLCVPLSARSPWLWPGGMHVKLLWRAPFSCCTTGGHCSVCLHTERSLFGDACVRDSEDELQGEREGISSICHILHHVRLKFQHEIKSQFFIHFYELVIMRGYSEDKCLSLLKVKGVSVVWSTLLTKKKNNNTQMPHSMKPPLPQSSQPCFSISYLFPLLGENCRRVAYIGMLPGLSCFKWNSLASTPPPPSSHNVTNTYILDGGGEEKTHSVQRQLAQIKCKETRQLQSQSRSADSALWTSATAGHVLFAGKNIAKWVRLKRTGG